MKMQTGSDFQVKFPDTIHASARQQIKATISKLPGSLAEQMALGLKQHQITRGSSTEPFHRGNTTASLNKNALSRERLRTYLSLNSARSGQFDGPPPPDSPDGVFDVAVYQAPFEAASYRWSFSASGANFFIDEASNRIYDAGLGITGNQIAVSLGVDSNDESIYFTSENVSLLLINHPMKTSGYLRVVGFIQCITDTDDVQILDHSQEFTFFGNVGLGSSETVDAHSLYVDINGENVGKSTFYQSDVIPNDTDDHDYTNLDNDFPSEQKTLGVAVPAQFNEGQIVPLWIGTGTSSNSHAVGQEIRTNTLQSWKLQEVWIITENSYTP
jgi:hypothetical protein